MRIAILLTGLLTASASAIAGTIAIASPHHPQTFAYGEIISHQLYAPCANEELVAQLTFSNLPYAGDDEPRRDESFDFHFPGVQFDSARRIFFARTRNGELIPVARFRKGFFLTGIDLAPGAKIYVLKESGRVTAILTASDHPRTGSHWIEKDNNFSLQNILISLFGEFFPESEN
jgi:hypothetical protein